MTKNKPFVTFIVMAYKAEKFIQEAIDGAFEQTYDNMEIIFSDDASPDRTFEIIEENIKNYTGKHKQNIRAFKNEKNMGIGAHLNKLWWQEAAPYHLVI
jgi:glycosyltransferase involved in cell wall biosynthesis